MFIDQIDVAPFAAIAAALCLAFMVVMAVCQHLAAEQHHERRASIRQLPYVARRKRFSGPTGGSYFKPPPGPARHPQQTAGRPTKGKSHADT